MKIVLDERLKHRLIGLAVIISLAAIFAPAIMKKSAQHMDREVGVHMKLPMKPQEPQVAIADQQDVFKTVKVAHVQLPELPAQEEPVPESRLASIEIPAIAESPEDLERDFEPLVQVAKPVEKTAVKSTPQKPQVSIAKRPAAPKPVSLSRKPAPKGQIMYSVQLASFAKSENAQVLVTRLRSKGYVARVTRVAGKNGHQYKVFVGKFKDRDQVLKLKNQLASGMKLNGFIVSEVG